MCTQKIRKREGGKGNLMDAHHTINFSNVDETKAPVFGDCGYSFVDYGCREAGFFGLLYW